MHRGLRHRGMRAGIAIVAAFAIIAVAAVAANAQKQSPPPAPQPHLLGVGAFVGGWGHHGAWLTIQPDGTGHASWRIYQWCSDDPTPPCDAVSSDEIVDGGHADFRITAVNGSEASAIVVGSSARNDWPDGKTTFSLIPDDGLHVSNFVFTDFCAQDHWSVERCGA